MGNYQGGCQDNSNFFPPGIWEGLKKIPALRYMKEPVDYVSELYSKYKDKAKKNSFAFVHHENTFYTYHPRGWNRGEWKPISADSVSSFFEIDAEFLKDGDILVYNSSKEKFVVKSGNVWNKLLGDVKDRIVQVGRFFNEVDLIPTNESDSGIYFVHNIELTALYLVLRKDVIKIFNSSDYYITSVIDEKLRELKDITDTKLDKSDVGNLAAGILFQDIEVANVSQLTNPLPGGQVPKDKWGVWVESEHKYYQYNASTNTWTPTPFTEKPSNFISKNDVDTEALEAFRFISNNEFILAALDSNEQVLVGIRRNNGDLYTPNIPSNLQNAIYKAIKPFNYILTLFKVNQIDGWLDISFDSKGAIIEGTRTDGTKYIAKGIPEDVKKELSKLNAVIRKIRIAVDEAAKNKVDKVDGKSLINEKVAEGTFYEESKENHIQQERDKNKRIIAYTTTDGTKGIHKLRVHDSLDLKEGALNDLVIALQKAGISEGSGTGDWTDKKSLALPKVRKYAIVNLIMADNKLPISKTENKAAVMQFWDLGGNYTKKPIISNAQGDSSMGYGDDSGGKNYTADLYNEDGSSFEMQFGNWRPFDSWHWKKYYIDCFRGQCVASYWLVENMYQTRSLGQRKPWEYLNASASAYNATGDLKADFETGALAHPDGFPFLLFVNGVFNGIHSWCIKKHRDNYNMKKDNANHIILDGTLSAATFWMGVIDWTAFEIRNPKDLIDVNGNKYDGDNPKELSNTHAFSLSVKNKIIRLSGAVPAIQANKTKATYEQYFNVPFSIDYFLDSQVIMNFDGFAKNWIWCTWDGLIGCPTAYDHDSIFGMHYTGVLIYQLSNKADSTILGLSENLPSGLCWTLYKDEIKARYAELRDKGVFSVEHIIGRLKEWIDKVGYDNYKLEFERFRETPSYRDSKVNSDYWEVVDQGMSGIAAYSDSTTYNLGDLVMYGAASIIYRAKSTTLGNKPLLGSYTKAPYEGGFYNSVERVQKWLEIRIDFLDQYFDYNN